MGQMSGRGYRGRLAGGTVVGRTSRQHGGYLFDASGTPSGHAVARQCYLSAINEPRLHRPATLPKIHSRSAVSTGRPTYGRLITTPTDTRPVNSSQFDTRCIVQQLWL